MRFPVLGLFWQNFGPGIGGNDSSDPFHPPCTCPEVGGPKSDDLSGGMRRAPNDWPDPSKNVNFGNVGPFLAEFRPGSRGKRFLGPVSPPVHLPGGRGTQIGPSTGQIWVWDPSKNMNLGNCWPFLAEFWPGSRGKRFLGPVSPLVHLSGGRGIQIGPFGCQFWLSGTSLKVDRPEKKDWIWGLPPIYF